MLERIEIRNFQSHKATNLDLESSVNTIQGNSDCGKSSVMRALNWLTFNPAGDYFISDWAKKGKSISAPCEVTLFIDGHKVTRRRDKDFNGYYLDDQVFEATRNSVPPQIQEILGLSEVNFQKQLDAPFLLSLSPGDVSRYVNRLVNLTKIDTWVTAINSRTRKLNQELEDCEARFAEDKALVDSYSWVPGLKKLSSEVTELDKKSNEISNEFESLNKSVKDYEEYSLKLTEIPDVDKVLELLKEISELNTKISESSIVLENLSNQVSDYEVQQSTISSLPDLEKVNSNLSEALELQGRQRSVENQLISLSNEIARYLNVKVPEVSDDLFSLIEEIGKYSRVASSMYSSLTELGEVLRKYDHNSIIVKSCNDEISDLESELSKMVCPVCGRSANHNH